MTNWFEVTAKYQKTDEDGRQKMVSEPYLIDAVSFTEAEARGFERIREELPVEFQITNIRKSNISEVVPNEYFDDWFKCKVSFVMLDEESGKEKKVNNYFLVQANDTTQAVNGVNESLKEMLAPFEVPSISLTKIVDVFPYFTDEVNEPIPSNLKPIDEDEDITG